MQMTPNYYEKLRSWLETPDWLKARSCVSSSNRAPTAARQVSCE